LAIIDALVLCESCRRPPPAWLVEAVAQLVDTSTTPLERKRRRELMIHFARWDAVRELCDRRDEFEECGDDRARTWENRYAAVSELFEGTLAAGVPDTIKASYQFVQTEVEEGRGWQFYLADPSVDPTSNLHVLRGELRPGI
jgi:hypothetical protein